MQSKIEPSVGKKIKKSEKDSIPTIEYSSVIVGSGPIGLLSTLAALKYSPKDKVALLADRRDELGVREQVLWIQQDVYDYIKSLVGAELIEQFEDELAITKDGDYDPTNPHKAHGYFITTGDLERLAFAALNENYEQGVHFDLIDTRKITPDQSYADAIKIDKVGKKVTVFAEGTNGEKHDHAIETTLKFKYLVASDGAKRSIAKSLGEKELFFDGTQKALQHKRHVVATFKIPEGTSPRACSTLKVRASVETGVPEPVVMDAQGDVPKRVITPCSMEKLREYGWKGNTRPYSQVFATRDVIYIGVELPESLPKERAQEYAQLLLRDQLPEDYLSGLTEIECDLRTNYGKKKAMLKTSVFDLELGDLNRTLVACGHLDDEEDIGAILFMGDSRKNPLYTTGSGAQTGVREVRNFEELLKDRHAATHSVTHDLEKFHASSRSLLDAIVEKQDVWINGRVTKEKEACSNFNAFAKYREQINRVNYFIKDLIDVVDEIEASKVEGVTKVPPLIATLKKELLELQAKHKKAFACCKGEAHITCYNGINVGKLLEDMQAVRIKILIQYPSLENLIDSTPVGAYAMVSEAYSELKGALKDFSKPTTIEIGFFKAKPKAYSPTLPTIHEEEEEEEQEHEMLM